MGTLARNGLTSGQLLKNVTKCSLRRATKIIHNESFKYHNCSVEMSCAVVWLRRVYIQKQPPLKKVIFKYFAKFT